MANKMLTFRLMATNYMYIKKYECAIDRQELAYGYAAVGP